MGLKRYLLFAGYEAYCLGGWLDFKGSFDALEDAVAAGKAASGDWWHVIDAETSEIIKEPRKDRR